MASLWNGGFHRVCKKVVKDNGKGSGGFERVFENPM